MGPGPVGEAILFVMSLAASIIVGVGVKAFLARCVLVIVQETGLGHDEVTWPGEPYLDWLGHAVLFFELLGLWVAPAALAARLLRQVWLPDAGALRVLLLAGPGLWLFFPIGLLSSLSAESRWMPFRWTIFLRFLRIAPAALVFYLLSGVLLGGAAALWYVALFGGRGILLPVAAMVGAAVVFIYARLLGRIAWMIQRLPSTQRTPVRPKVEKAAAPVNLKPRKPRGKKKRKPIAEVQDPWAVPEEEKAHRKAKRFPWAEEPPPKPKSKAGYEIPSAEDIEGYGIASDQPAAAEEPPERPPRSSVDSPPETYEPTDPEAATAEPSRSPEPQSELFAAQVRQRLAERERAELPPPPHPFFSGVYTFPFYPLCLPNWLALAVFLLIEGGIVYMMIEFGHGLFG